MQVGAASAGGGPPRTRWVPTGVVGAGPPPDDPLTAGAADSSGVALDDLGPVPDFFRASVSPVAQ